MKELLEFYIMDVGLLLGFIGTVGIIWCNVQLIRHRDEL
jgi:hypothetical protein